VDRRPLISGNWKMHHNHFEALQLVQKLSYLLTAEDHEAVEVSVHPPFTDIRTVQTFLLSEKEPVPIAIGAQNCHPEDTGAFTGEVSAGMLAKLDVRYVIAGHSERRELFGEDDGFVNAKVKAVLKWGMTPILCVGETLDEREAGATEEKVRRQVEAGLEGLSGGQVGSMVIAYEPIWAIGTGRTASAQDAQSVCSLVREVAGGCAGSDAAASLRVQYGGSVKPANATELMEQTDIDGALVGGASLDADDFARIVQYRL
jgi:triosephosphate isomerase (TIM)